MAYAYAGKATRLTAVLVAAGLAACGEDLEPNAVLIELAPDIISSIDGTTTVRALLVDDRTPVADQDVTFTIAYTDRNGVEHAIEPLSARTDERGAASAVISGLDWEGTGTVTAALAGDAAVAASASFSVLDRTPPAIEILPPTEDLHVGQGFPVEIDVRVTDEIGISEVFFEADGEVNDSDSTLVASGSTEATVRFRIEVPDDATPGPTITLYAMAADLSGNLVAAVPVVLTVDEALAIATPPGLVGELMTEGDANFLEDPRALALSPRDGLLYVADNSGNAPCNGGCIRQVDPADGSLSAGVVVLANGTAEGIAFDATGDTLFYSDRNGRIGRLTYNAGNAAYENNTLCTDAQDPQDPFHLVVDAVLGVLIAEGNDQRVVQVDACVGDPSSQFSDSPFDEPRGIALGAAGEIYVSDVNTGRIHLVDRNDGSVAIFEDQDPLNAPYGLAWLAGGTSAFADSLLIADLDRREVFASRGTGIVDTAAFLRNDPIDVELDGAGTLYILTRPSNNDRGRIFKVTGF